MLALTMAEIEHWSNLVYVDPRSYVRTYFLQAIGKYLLLNAIIASRREKCLE